MSTYSARIWRLLGTRKSDQAGPEATAKDRVVAACEGTRKALSSGDIDRAVRFVGTWCALEGHDPLTARGLPLLNSVLAASGNDRRGVAAAARRFLDAAERDWSGSDRRR